MKAVLNESWRWLVLWLSGCYWVGLGFELREVWSSLEQVSGPGGWKFVVLFSVPIVSLALGMALPVEKREAMA